MIGVPSSTALVSVPPASGRGAETRCAVLHLGRNGGGPKFALALASAISALGRPVATVVARTADNRQGYDTVGPVLELDTFASASGALLRSPLLLGHALRLRRFLDAHEIDVVVVAMEQIWQAPLLAMALGRRRRMVLCVHDATMHPGLSNPIERLTLRLHRTLADGAVTFSEHVAATLERRGTFPTSRIWRSVHGSYASSVGLPRASPADPPVIGFFGRLATYKGLGVAYDAVRLLRSAGRRVRFHVVGEGADPVLASMQHADDLVERGWVEDAAIPERLDAFDVLVLPYLEASQSGVFAYAMGRGVPMVVTPVGGLREQAEETSAALVAADVSPEAVAAALAALLDDPDRYRGASEAGLVASTGTHSWQRTARDVLAAVDSVAARGRPVSGA